MKKSKVIENGGPKLPTAEQLVEGELAVNYAKGYETLSIKNDSGDVITFSSDGIINRIIAASAQTKVNTSTYTAYTAATADIIAGKADKVSGSVNGNLAGLDSNGNLTDSGTKIADLKEGTDIIKRLVFTGGNAFIHPVNTDGNGNYVFDGNWTIEVLHPLTANGFVKATDAGNTYEKFNKIVIPNGNYNFTYSAVIGQWFYDYSIWYNTKNMTFVYASKKPADDPNWFEAFEDVMHPYYGWEPKPEGLMGVRVVSKPDQSDYYIVFPQLKKDYLKGTIYMDDILPDNVSSYPVDLWRITVMTLSNRMRDTKLVFSEKIYRINSFPNTNVNIVGEGIDKTIFSLYNATTNEETSYYTTDTFHSIHIKDCTIKNLGFEHYNSSAAIDKSAVFESVKFWVTIGLPGQYLIHTSSVGFNLYIRNCILLNESANAKMYAGIWTEKSEYVEITNTKIGDYFIRPCANYYAHRAFIDNVEVTNGTTGIFFAANKENPLENSVVQNCIVRFVDEECISFDSLGNNVEGNPMVCELSITDGEIIQDTVGSNTNKRLKLYCNARHLVGTHPNEQYEAYSIVDNAELVKKMYVAFDEPAGDVFAGTVVKVLDCGQESDGEEREWILIDTQLPFEDLVLLPNTDVSTVNNNYKVAMVTSGFFNVRVSHNKCYGGKATGIALYNAIYHCTVDNNHVSNCRGGSYLYASKMLATEVYNGACGNIITNNVFEGGEGYGFDFAKYSNVFGYHNIFSNNLILNNNGVRITNEKELTYEGNSIIGPDAILDLSNNTWGTNVVETSKFGTGFPTVPYLGQRYFRKDESKEYMWNGTGWVASVTSVNGSTGAVVIGNATTSAAGLMSAADKQKMDGVLGLTIVTGTTVTQVLSPNMVYSFGEMESLTITLDTPLNGVNNQYIFEFDSGSIATVLSVPNNVIWPDTLVIQAGKHYEMNIKYNASMQAYYGLVEEW